MSNYFRLNALESDSAKLVEWLTDYDTQQLIIGCFERGEQAFYKEPDGNTQVHRLLETYYRIWFDPENIFEGLPI